MNNCTVCGEPGATFPSVGTPGEFMCDDAVACLNRFELTMEEANMLDGEEDDFESD